MRVLVLGAGALGSLLGARLHASGQPVALYSTNSLHIRRIKENGLRLQELDGEEKLLHPPALDRIRDLPWSPELVLTLVKSGNTAEAVRAVLPHCPEDSVFLTLQNGIGNADAIGDLAGYHRVLAGTTAQGATLLEPGIIRHGGQGPTHVGRPGGKADASARQVADLLQTAGVPCETSDEVDRLIWKKLLVNVGINAVTALTRLPNGWIQSEEPGRELASSAVLEAKEVAAGAGFDFGESVAQEVLEVAERTSSNRSSMLQDVDAGKPTEIEAINGAVEGLARSYGISAPVNWTLTRLIRLVDAAHKQGEEAYG